MRNCVNSLEDLERQVILYGNLGLVTLLMFYALSVCNILILFSQMLSNLLLKLAFSNKLQIAFIKVMKTITKGKKRQHLFIVDSCFEFFVLFHPLYK